MSTNKTKYSNNIHFMRLALNKAHSVIGNTKENPAVGCVIVKKNSVIASASTSINGRPHAEYNAIKKAGSKIKNSDLYVTLEPCSHYGKTPPCALKIIKNKISKVYFSINDPDHRSYNKSSYLFKKRNIKVNRGLLSHEVNNFYKSYIKNRKMNLPYVTSKIAISKDFYTHNKSKKWLTNKYSRGRVHLMRSEHDCIMTSSKTIKADNPKLNCRINGLESRSPVKVILDKNLETPLNSQIFYGIKNSNTIIFYNKPIIHKIQKFQKLKVRLIKTKVLKDGNFNLKDILIKLYKFGFTRIFLEAGVNLNNNFLKHNLIDTLHVFVSDSKVGKKGLFKVKDNIKHLLNKKKPVQKKVNLLGDKLLSYNV